jgi:hypothetical protein
MSLCGETIVNYGSDVDSVYQDSKCWNCKKLGWYGVFDDNDNVSSVTYFCIECDKKKFTNYCSADQLKNFRREQMIRYIKDRHSARYFNILEKHCGGDPDKFDTKKFTPY